MYQSLSTNEWQPSHETCKWWLFSWGQGQKLAYAYSAWFRLHLHKKGNEDAVLSVGSWDHALAH